MRTKIVNSTWFLTINSNIVNKPENQPEIDKFTRCIRRVFASSGIVNFLTVVDKEDVSIPKTKLLESVVSDLELEVGPVQKRVHAHGTVTVFHYTSLEFNQPKLCTFFT